LWFIVAVYARGILNMNNQNADLEKTIKALRRSRMIGWFLGVFLVFVLSVSISVVLSKYPPLNERISGFFPTPTITFTPTPIIEQIQPTTTPIPSPTPLPEGNLILNYPTIAEFGSEIRIVVTFIEDGIPANGKVMFEKDNISIGEIDLIDGLGSFSYEPDIAGQIQINVSVIDKNIQRAVSILIIEDPSSSDELSKNADTNLHAVSSASNFRSKEDINKIILKLEENTPIYILNEYVILNSLIYSLAYVEAKVEINLEESNYRLPKNTVLYGKDASINMPDKGILNDVPVEIIDENDPQLVKVYGFIALMNVDKP